MNNQNMDLSREDLLEMENRLCEYLSRFLAFTGQNVFFPADQPGEIEYLREEKRLFIPLIWRDQYLGALMLLGVRAKEVKKLLPILPSIVSLCLELLAMQKSMRLDSATSLDSEESFFSHLEEEVDKIRSQLEDPGQSSQSMRSMFKICLGMMVISWADAHLVARRLDYEFCDRAFRSMARVLKENVPPETKITVLGRYEWRYEFGLLFLATGRGACARLAADIMARLESITYADEISGARVNPFLQAGFALYPQDMRGHELRLPMLEQALRLRDRARLASRFAAANGDLKKRIMPFNVVLQRGGKVTANLGRGKLLINLGETANASEGMIFNVFSGVKRKGKIVLLETRPKDSIAEILYVEDAGFFPEPGDTLTLLDSSAGLVNMPRDSPPKENDGTGESPTTQGLPLWSHAEFLGHFAGHSGKYSKYVLGISKLSRENGQPPDTGELESFHLELNGFFDALKKDAPNLTPQLAGRYGGNSLIFFHGDATSELANAFYLRLSELARKKSLIVTSGLFAYPFLNFTRAESEACALKALEYAQLLPEPKTGLLNSIALTISADKRYSLGDVFGAIEEYRLALLADPDNAMARNSLGVCMGDIGKREDAVKIFNEALASASNPDLKAKIYYNLGVVFQKRNEPESANDYYRRCVKLDPDHVYAWMRLGQICEQRGRKAEARKNYEKAFSLADNDPRLKNMAGRHIARLEESGGKSSSARDLLHDALIRDPDDTASMLALAKSYLADKEDLAMAEMLARKSAELGGSPESWRVLAEILVEQGKREEAIKAWARAERN